MVTQFLRKVPNWKAPGPDMAQGFLFTGLHHNIANQLQVCLDCGMGMRIEKQLPTLKRGEELKIFKNGKKSRYMDSMQDRVKNKEVRKRGPG